MTGAASQASRVTPALPTLRPMLSRPAVGPLDNPNYAYEIKWDGMRIIAGVGRNRVSLLTRNGLEAASRFPELQCLGEQVKADDAILDGEVVTLRDGRPDFWLLQQRILASGDERIMQLSEAEPAALILFDVLRVGSRWLLDMPWNERRQTLEALVITNESIQLSPIWEHGSALWSIVNQFGMEGVMAKLRDSRYLPGTRSPAWLKIKVTHTLDVVVCGWTEGAGERTGRLGALILGCMGQDGLRYVGHVGSGFNNRALADALDQLKPLEVGSCPFGIPPITNGRPHWVRPERVCEVKHQNWSGEGRLRSPVFLRWRPDKTPGDLYGMG